MSIESVLANRSLVKGFLVPIFYDEHSSQSALGPEDFQKVVGGYACAKCLAEYTTYLVRCPICQHQRDLAADLEAPDDLHVDHLRERETTEGQNLGGDPRTGKPRTFDDLMADISKNSDIDHVALSKLKPRRRA